MCIKLYSPKSLSKIGLAQVFDAGGGCFLHHNLDTVVSGLGGGILLAAADDFTVGRDVIEAVLAGVEEGFEALGLAIGLHGPDAVLAAGLGGVALAGLDNLAVAGTEVVPILAAGVGNLESCHRNKLIEVEGEMSNSKLSSQR